MVRVIPDHILFCKAVVGRIFYLFHNRLQQLTYFVISIYCVRRNWISFIKHAQYLGRLNGDKGFI